LEFWPEEECGQEGICQRNDKGDLKRIKILNEKKGYKQSTDHGPNAFEDINPSDGGDIFFDVLGIEFTPVSEKSTQRKGNREEYQERGIEDRGKSKSLARSGQKNAFKYPGKIGGKWKGRGKRKLVQNKNLHLSFRPFHKFTGKNRTDRHKDEPVAENDSKGELITKKRDKELPQQENLCDYAAQAHYHERDLKE
jgi:hypothetical protein